jgi:3',5'-cyclic AMP phosphodiesterase CpdA
VELTTVADDQAVVHDGHDVRVHGDLTPDRAYEIDGFAFRTLSAPGELLSRFATVNDVHFGETICGVMDGFPDGPFFAAEAGTEPYPVVMNRGAVAEMAAADVDAVVVKGDLTSSGTKEEYEQFLAMYEPAFGDRLHHVRGNHDAYHGATFASDAPFVVDLPGVRLAVIDTSIPFAAPGQVTRETLEWLGDVASEADRPVLVLGHHHVWSPESVNRSATYFGVNPDDSERLVELVAALPSVWGYFAGHTHRNRVRRFSLTGAVPWVEVACVKDYPGTWAEYRVHEGGILQIHRRINTPEALDWTEKTRDMFGGAYHEYAFGELSDRCFVIGPR